MAKRTPRTVPVTQKESWSNIEKYMRAREELVSQIKESTSGQYEPVVIDGVVTNYGVNNHGEVFSYVNNRPLNGKTNIDGKRQVTLCYQKDGSRIYKTKSIDQLVATAFIPNPDNCKYVCHHDNDPLNCNVGNLYWTNRKEISSNGFSADEIIEIFNSVLHDTECSLITEAGSWVREKFEYIIKHMKEQNYPVDGRLLLKAYREISNRGKTSDRYGVSPFGIIKNFNTERYMFGSLSYYGYPVFKTDIGGKKQNIAIHRLVANAFLSNDKNLEDAHHINSNILDSCVWNLEWVSHKVNMERGIALSELQSGENRYNARYANSKIHEVCKLIDQKIYSPKKISEMTGVDLNTINDIRDGIKWRIVSVNYEMPYCMYDKSGNFVGVDASMSAKVDMKLSEYRRKLNSSNIGSNRITISDLHL